MKNFGFIAAAVVLVGFLVFAVIYSTSGPSGPHPEVVMETSMGTIKLELFQDKAPITVENFLKYVDAKHYDGTIFHRVISDFMIQGGGFTPGMVKKAGARASISNEAGNSVSNARGTIAMARTPDPDSATDQFFINVKDNARSLDRTPGNAGYAVFGRVIDGMDVVDKIREVRVVPNEGGEKATPVQDVIIKSIRRVEPK
jgi:cyclophilin family peptidyl-prolyl cis-trans isomerase